MISRGDWLDDFRTDATFQAARFLALIAMQRRFIDAPARGARGVYSPAISCCIGAARGLIFALAWLLQKPLFLIPLAAGALLRHAPAARRSIGGADFGGVRYCRAQHFSITMRTYL